MSNELLEVEREVESKFDVPLNTDKAHLMLEVGDMAAKQLWTLVGCRYEVLVFQFFDTTNFDAYRNGDTIRCVGGFRPASSPKAAYRYDFKVGPLDNRIEKKLWDDRVYTPSELVSAVQLPEPYTTIAESALANTNHLKMFFEKEGTRIEVTQDIFSVKEGNNFRELEIELQKGNPEPWRDLSEKVRTEIGLQPVHIQKYARVIESMPKYRDLIQR